MQKPRRNGKRKGKKKTNTAQSMMKRTAGSQKAFLRRELRGNEHFPHSSKIGAGDRTAIRQAYKGKHRKNHRQKSYLEQKIHSSAPIVG